MRSQSRQRERLIACGLTVCAMLMLFVLAGAVRFSRSPSEMLELTFQEALNIAAVAPTLETPTPNPTTPTAGPRRTVIHPDLLPKGETTPLLQNRPEARIPTPANVLVSDAHQTTDGANRSSRPLSRDLIPRTRAVQLSGRDLTLTSRTPTREENKTAGGVRPALAALSVREDTERSVTPPMESVQREPLPPAPIVQWIQSHLVELPAGVRLLVGYAAGAVTSVSTLSLDGETYELYLMAYPATQEMHIVLVRDTQSHYFIDRGGQQEAHKYRVGTVRRVQGEIMRIISEDRPIDSPEALLLWQAYRSWWQDQNSGENI